MGNSNDARQGLIGIAQVVLVIITAVFFLTWVYRISWNGHYFSNSTQRHSPGWAVAYFFIPIVNLWRPYQALWDAHQAFIDRTADSKGNFIFQLWWFAWLVSCFLGRALFKTSMKAEELGELIQSSLLTVGTDSFNIFLDVMALLLVMLVTKACCTHNERYISEVGVP